MSVNFTLNLQQAMECLYKQGAFLTTKVGDDVNTMTISWGNIGFQWGKPVFTALVRKSRYTYEFLEKADSFTISIPLNNEMKEALSYCGSKSGRNVDKFKECNLTLKEGRKVNSPIIEHCNTIYYECKMVYKQPVTPNLLVGEVQENNYKDGNYHTLYFGEIVDCYML